MPADMYGAASALLTFEKHFYYFEGTLALRGNVAMAIPRSKENLAGLPLP